MKNFLNSKQIFVLTYFLLSSLNVQAGSYFSPNCHELVKVELPSSEVVQQLDSAGSAVYKKYLKTGKKFKLDSLLKPEEVLQIVSDRDVGLYRDQLQVFLDDLLAQNKNIDVEKFAVRYLKKKLKTDLFKQEEISQRLALLKTEEYGRWYRLLGDRTRSEVRDLFLGKTKNLDIDPESLVGSYIQKTGAAFRYYQHPVRPDENKKGPKRLLVAVSEASFAQFQKIAERPEYLSVLGHANILTKGEVIAYNQQRLAARLPSVNTPLPFVLLKSSEAYRLQRYLHAVTDVFNQGWNTPLKLPWYLKAISGKNSSYCARGGYECCTHHIGNMPIGDVLVDGYTFPGNEYGTPNEKKPQYQKLKPYKVESENHKILYDIWTVPGHQQFSHVIGQGEANNVGEFASPGYVIHTLLGPTSEEYVPIVFVVVDDVRTIPKAIQLQFEHPR